MSITAHITTDTKLSSSRKTRYKNQIIILSHSTCAAIVCPETQRHIRWHSVVIRRDVPPCVPLHSQSCLYTKYSAKCKIIVMVDDVIFDIENIVRFDANNIHHSSYATECSCPSPCVYAKWNITIIIFSSLSQPSSKHTTIILFGHHAHARVYIAQLCRPFSVSHARSLVRQQLTVYLDTPAQGNHRHFCRGYFSSVQNITAVSACAYRTN